MIMDEGSWMAFGIVTVIFLFWGIATRRWLPMFFSWLYLMIGVFLMILFADINPLISFFVMMFWIIYPIGRCLRNNGDI